jgi:hypothetical protein
MTISNLPTSLAVVLARIGFALSLDGIAFEWGTLDGQLWIESDYSGYHQTSWYPLSVEPTEVMRDFGIVD